MGMVPLQRNAMNAHARAFFDFAFFGFGYDFVGDFLLHMV
jgi:hypothetical protein